jgi:hypothetical protein
MVDLTSFFHSLLKTSLLICGPGAPQKPFRQRKESGANLNWKPLHRAYEHILQ